ncbi:zf-HC2 domain-containing protein [Sediminibacillus albus]|uniref:Putative zinc-finger n=1 Tax=Sediminibacillus albus TaxID=407036 RepID=A0A1G8ZT07_9BACI|nr:zf-HC2 domain-containing protein [Sediminibacillus albus]SDK17495.1 Putative zinc-finger [Sediminibacillus albus]
MSHVQNELLFLYIEDNIDGRRNRQQIENHLETCEHCFASYLDLLEHWETPAGLTDSFTDITIEKVKLYQSYSHLAEQRPSSYRSRQARTLVHYLLAAALTLVLMAGGIFQGVLDLTDQSNLDKRPSLTDNIMQKTDSWLTQLLKGERQ